MYNQEFYDQIHEGSVRSAREIVPTVLEVVQPEVVVDFGCGDGSWLSVFMEYGIDVSGIDGSRSENLQIPEALFIQDDLAKPYAEWDTPCPCSRYDLAISLEVAEHLPDTAADIFVEKITTLSDNILWSAAVPGQNGVGHINEQWPNYWVEKFVALGYVVSEDWRLMFWDNENIENWYRQNLLFFTRTPDKYPTLNFSIEVEDRIHPNNTHIVKD